MSSSTVKQLNASYVKQVLALMAGRNRQAPNFGHLYHGDQVGVLKNTPLAKKIGNVYPRGKAYVRIAYIKYKG